MKYQTVTAYDHQQNLVEQAIQTYKSFLISNLHGTDSEFPAHLCIIGNLNFVDRRRVRAHKTKNHCFVHTAQHKTEHE